MSDGTRKRTESERQERSNESAKGSKVTKRADPGKTAKQFAEELKAQSAKS